MGSHRGTISVTIKDISATGFAFSTSDEREFQENESVHAVLNDYVEETAKSYSFHLYGVIVRKFKLENGNMVYGCRFPARVIGLESYIMERRGFVCSAAEALPNPLPIKTNLQENTEGE